MQTVKPINPFTTNGFQSIKMNNANANAKCKMQNAKCKMQNAKCKMQNAKCKMQNAKCKSIQNKNEVKIILQCSTNNHCYKYISMACCDKESKG